MDWEAGLCAAEMVARQLVAATLTNKRSPTRACTGGPLSEQTSEDGEKIPTTTLSERRIDGIYPGVLYCSECGHQLLSDRAKFCSQCGSPSALARTGMMPTRPEVRKIRLGETSPALPISVAPSGRAPEYWSPGDRPGESSVLRLQDQREALSHSQSFSTLQERRKMSPRSRIRAALMESGPFSARSSLPCSPSNATPKPSEWSVCLPSPSDRPHDSGGHKSRADGMHDDSCPPAAATATDRGSPNPEFEIMEEDDHETTHETMRRHIKIGHHNSGRILLQAQEPELSLTPLSTKSASSLGAVELMWPSAVPTFTDDGGRDTAAGRGARGEAGGKAGGEAGGSDNGDGNEGGDKGSNVVNGVMPLAPPIPPRPPGLRLSPARKLANGQGTGSRTPVNNVSFREVKVRSVVCVGEFFVCTILDTFRNLLAGLRS